MLLIICYTVVQVLESFIIMPKIVGNSIGLHPIVVFIALLIDGAVFEIIGVVFAIPLAAIIFALYKEFIKKSNGGKVICL